MYYRYEARRKDSAEWLGIFASGALNPSQRRQWGRVLREPKWYEKNPDTASKCWFTEYGYEKYHNLMDEMISETTNVWKIRLITCDKLGKLVCKGKVQCVELV